MAYAKRYAAGFVDKPTLTTPIDATFLNAVETALLAIFDANPSASGQVEVWNGTKFAPKLLTNAEIDPAAAIVKTKLAALGIVDADVAGAAAIARSKLALATSIVQADMAPGNKTTTGTWAAGPPASPTTGDVWIATAAAGITGLSWQFQYDSAQTTYKWLFIGGPAAYAAVGAVETIITLGAVFSDLATVGPQVTALRAGDYYSSFSCQAIGGGVADNMYVAATIGAGAAAFGYAAVTIRSATAGDNFNLSGQGLVPAVGASGSIRMRYAGNTAAEQWSLRALSVTPVRII